MPDVSLTAGWALWGKQAGTRDDYSVLACSAQPLTQQEYAQVLSHFAPGTPPAEQRPPGSLNWVTISRVSVAERRYLGVAIQQTTAEVDGTGRPITRTGYLCVPYAELEQQPVSYGALFRQLCDLDLPLADSRPVRLEVPPLDPEIIAANIEGLKQVLGEDAEETVVRTAALVLAGQVSVVGWDGASLEQRLQFIDAVAAVLPYGYRTVLTAATWSDSAAKHRIRLAFAARPRPDAHVVRGRSAPEPPEGPAADYLRNWHFVRGCSPGRAGLAETIRHLAADREPCNFDQPQRAADSLHWFRLPFFALASVSGGSAPGSASAGSVPAEVLAEVRATFAANRVSELPADGGEHKKLLGALIRGGAQEDLGLIRQWWDPVTGDDAAAMLPELEGVCKRLVPGALVRQYARLAGERGLLDAILARLITGSAGADDPAVVAQLVADGLREGHLQPGRQLHTTEALRARPQVACELFAQAGTAQPVVLDWLDPVLRDCLRPFAAVRDREPGGVSRSQIATVAGYHPDCVRVLVRTAADTECLELVLPGLAGWLAQAATPAGRPDPRHRAAWSELDFPLTDPGYQAWLDLARLASGNEPRFLLQHPDPASQAEYAEYLAAGWESVTAELGPECDRMLAGQLRARARQLRVREGEAVVPVVDDLVGRLFCRDLARALRPERTDDAPDAPAERRRAVRRKSRQRREPDGAGQPEAPPVPGPAGPGGPHAAEHPGLAMLALLRNLPPDADLASIAELCGQACRDGLPGDDVAAALAGSLAITSAERALGLVAELRLRLLVPAGQLPPGMQDPARFLNWIVRAIARGDFPLPAADFEALAIPFARSNLEQQLHMIYVVATQGDKLDAPRLSGEDASALRELWLQLGRMISEAAAGGAA